MRFLGQIATNLKAGLDAALAPAVDPRTTYVNAHQKQEALLAQVRLAMNHVTASKERMQARAVEDRARLPQMLEEARAELVAGHTEAARVRLQRRHVVALELAALEAQVADVERDESNLRMLEGRLANQVEEFVARQQVIVARYNAAEAQIQIKEAVTGVSREFAELTAALTEAEEKTEGMEARVSAIDRLVREGLLGASDQLAEVGDARRHHHRSVERAAHHVAAVQEEVHRHQDEEEGERPRELGDGGGRPQHQHRTSQDDAPPRPQDHGLVLRQVPAAPKPRSVANLTTSKARPRTLS